ncbi:hypothetical protein [Streptomyces sp. NPDC001889]
MDELVTLHGGPLDGTRIGVDPADPDPGVALVCDHGMYGEGGRSWYTPGPDGRWVWSGDSA